MNTAIQTLHGIAKNYGGLLSKRERYEHSE